MLEEGEKIKETIRICSIDIGWKNFCICVEEYSLEALDQIENTSSSSQYYNPDGTPTLEIKDILNTLYSIGKIIHYENYDISKGTQTTAKYLDPQVYHIMYDKLRENKDIFSTCDIILVEQQVRFGKMCNPKCCDLGQHCRSYFIFEFGLGDKKVIEFPAYHKTQVHGCPKDTVKDKRGRDKYISMPKKKRKDWAIEKTREILELRGDEEHLELFSKKPRKKGVIKVKLDDLADSLLQSISWVYMNYIEKKK